jgi:hypothetical protein
VSKAVAAASRRHSVGRGLTLAFLLACGKRSFVPPEQQAPPPPRTTAPADPTPFAFEPAPLLPFPHVDTDGVELAPYGPFATTCEGVSLVLSVTTNLDSIDTVVELRNASGKNVPLMLTGDGSSRKRRNPTLTFELSPNRVTPQAGCGNMNALTPREIIVLAPGERRRLEWVDVPTPSQAGRYTLRATYENDPTSKELGDNPSGPATDRLIARVKKTVPCRLSSNTVTFVWSPRSLADCTCQAGDPLCTCR